MQWEYCTVKFEWKGGGYSQEILKIYLDGRELTEWRDRPWPVFLNQLGKEGWEMIAAKEADSSTESGILFFKRGISQ